MEAEPPRSRIAHDARHRSGPPAEAAADLPPVPEELVDLLAGAAAAQVWVKRESEVWRAELRTGPVYVKIMDDLEPWTDELARLRWCTDRSPLPTPRVLAQAVDARERGWFVATEVPGTPSHDPSLVEPDPSALVRGLAAGLRRFHDEVGVGGRASDACPFRLSAGDLIASAAARVAAGGVDPSTMRNEADRHRTPDQLLALLVDTRPDEPAEDQVVTHGDACQPNLLVERASGGVVELVGLVDLGRLAVTDRYRDLAIAARSLDVNVGPEAAAAFTTAYGTEPVDRERLEWWTLVDDLW